MPREALFWKKQQDDKILCTLCPRGCVIPPGGKGYCLGRVNRDGVLYAESYAKTTSLGLDPIEKKPLYHFAPGTKILSAGTYGCNLGCLFCQNYTISKQSPPGIATREVPPDELIRLALEQGVPAIAYTYNEPFVWYEYVLDTARRATEHNLANVLVTNGYVNPEPLEKILPFIQAMNVDIKAFNNRFYPELCSAELAPVLETARRAAAAGVHVETTTLIIPNRNDSPDEAGKLAEWISRNLGENTPMHVSAYRPMYKMTEPPTPRKTLYSAWAAMKKHLSFVYMGNIVSPEGLDTVCKSCGNTLIKRSGYDTALVGVTEDMRCSKCNADNNLVSLKKTRFTSDNK